MKRTLQFKETDSGYACFESNEKIFEISSMDLQFNVKDFYQAFYGEDKDFEDIDIVNCIEDDKNARHVYDCINKLIAMIKEKFAELPEEDEESDAEQTA